MNCPNPNCGREMFLLGKATTGKWEPTGKYRCNDCPPGKNRFEIRDGKPVAIESKVPCTPASIRRRLYP